MPPLRRCFAAPPALIGDATTPLYADNSDYASAAAAAHASVVPLLRQRYPHAKYAEPHEAADAKCHAAAAEAAAASRRSSRCTRLRGRLAAAAPTYRRASRRRREAATPMPPHCD